MNYSRLSFTKTLQSVVKNNLRNIIISIVTLVLLLILSQIYIYLNDRNLKETSVKFFNTLNNEEDLIPKLQNISNENNIYSLLSKLKLIQINNNNKKFDVSNELYKSIILSKDLDTLYKSAIAVSASYVLINASYSENTNRYIDDISNYITYINNELESYVSIKKELEYLILITEIDVNNLDYKNNNKVLELYNSISNSTLISPSVKGRVKKIHEFQLYK